MTHLGKYTAHFEGSAEIVGGRILGEGTFTVVAANGHELTGTFTTDEGLSLASPIRLPSYSRSGAERDGSRMRAE